MELNANFWNDRYKNEETQWDAGSATTPLTAYFDSLDDQHIKILIPGCGNAHEAAYLHSKGFTQVHVLDYAEMPIENFKKNNPTFPEDHVHVGNFFDHQGSYDLIVEQTFFCAIDPSLRKDYVKQMHALLSEKGVLMGLLFNEISESDGPPYGGNITEYTELFRSHFKNVSFEAADNSIKPRANREAFMEVSGRLPV